jgi:thiamine pyrophosphate-dependent acetolactate synthase large subunit-like protein
MAIPLADALRVLISLRKPNQVVVTTMSAAREWPRLEEHPLNLHYIPSTMGGGPPLGLGIALAQPEREVVVVTGDGSLLMNLGSLVTIAAQKAANLTIVVLDNGIYEVTGGQTTAAVFAGADYAAMARASGIPSVSRFDHLAGWREQAAAVLASPGPRLVQLKIEPELTNFMLDPPGPIGPRLETLRAALSSPVTP